MMSEVPQALRSITDLTVISQAAPHPLLASFLGVWGDCGSAADGLAIKLDHLVICITLNNSSNTEIK